MKQDNRTQQDVEPEKPLENQNLPLHDALPAWLGLKGVTLVGSLNFLLPLSIPVVLAAWGTWQTENNTMLSREQDIKKEFQSQDDENAKLVATYYEAMTRFMESPKFNDKKMREVMRARTLNTFSQLSDDVSQNEDKKKNEPEYQCDSLKISDRASIPVWKLLFGGSQESLKAVEACTQKQQSINDSFRKGEILKFLYNAELIGTCPSLSDNVKDSKNISCKDSVFSLDGAKLSSAKSELPMRLAGVNLSRARLINANLREIDLYKANLSNAYLDRADLTSAFLEKADMQFISLEEANLEGAILTGANLQFARLKNSNLSNADFSSADLSGADLRDTNLTDANLDGTNVSEAKYTDKTKWPAGFNSKGKKLILCPSLEANNSTGNKGTKDPRCS